MCIPDPLLARVDQARGQEWSGQAGSRGGCGGPEAWLEAAGTGPVAWGPGTGWPTGCGGRRSAAEGWEAGQAGAGAGNGGEASSEETVVIPSDISRAGPAGGTGLEHTRPTAAAGRGRSLHCPTASSTHRWDRA